MTCYDIHCTAWSLRICSVEKFTMLPTCDQPRLRKLLLTNLCNFPVVFVPYAMLYIKLNYTSIYKYPQLSGES